MPLWPNELLMGSYSAPSLSVQIKCVLSLPKPAPFYGPLLFMAPSQAHNHSYTFGAFLSLAPKIQWTNSLSAIFHKSIH